MTTAFKLYKLIVLYMLNCIDFPLTDSQISEFVLEQGYTDYFKLHQVIGELAEDGLIRKESTHNLPRPVVFIAGSYHRHSSYSLSRDTQKGVQPRGGRMQDYYHDQTIVYGSSSTDSAAAQRSARGNGRNRRGHGRDV